MSKPWVAVAAALVATVATFLDWGSSGSARRSAYELIDVADRAGVLESPWAGLAVILYAVPASTGLALIAISVDRPIGAAILSGTVGAIALVGAVLVARSPLGVEIGVPMAGVAGAAAVADSIRSAVAALTTKAD